MFTHVNYTLEFGVSSHMFGEEIRSDLLIFLYIFFSVDTNLWADTIRSVSVTDSKLVVGYLTLDGKSLYKF